MKIQKMTPSKQHVGLSNPFILRKRERERGWEETVKKYCRLRFTFVHVLPCKRKVYILHAHALWQNVESHTPASLPIGCSLLNTLQIYMKSLYMSIANGACTQEKNVLQRNLVFIKKHWPAYCLLLASHIIKSPIQFTFHVVQYFLVQMRHVS